MTRAYVTEEQPRVAETTKKKRHQGQCTGKETNKTEAKMETKQKCDGPVMSDFTHGDRKRERGREGKNRERNREREKRERQRIGQIQKNKFERLIKIRKEYQRKVQAS